MWSLCCPIIVVSLELQEDLRSQFDDLEKRWLAKCGMSDRAIYKTPNVLRKVSATLMKLGHLGKSFSRQKLSSG